MPAENFAASSAASKAKDISSGPRESPWIPPAQRIYVTDTLRQQIWVLDMAGQYDAEDRRCWRGRRAIQFPTELRLDGQDLLVVDAMNFRVQVLDRSGKFEYAIGQVGDGSGYMFRPKGIGRDSEGHLYVVEGLSGMVQVFDRQGQLLYTSGRRAAGSENFNCPRACLSTTATACLWWIPTNRRVQIFQYLPWEIMNQR